MSFVVYKSSAGSGKTFTLVREYLKLILPEPDRYRHILAITFTNKAANEMKERVLYNLKELAKTSSERDSKVNEILLPQLVRETSLQESLISIRAAEALKLILHNYSDFAIGTIDSFSHRIIRTFAHDFGLHSNFNVELDSDELLETAVDLLLDKVGDDKDLTDVLVKFLESRMEDDKGWEIDRILQGFSRMLLNEEGMMHLTKIRDLKLQDFLIIIPEIFNKIRDFENRIRKIAGEGAELIKENGIPISSFFQGEKGIGGYFTKLSLKKMDSLKSDSYPSQTVNENRWTSAKASQDDKVKIQDISSRLSEIYHQIKKEKEQGYHDYLFLKMLANTIYPLAVLNEIDQTLEAFKKQNNIIHISEFNRRIAGIVLNEPVPFIYERIGEKYNHILIDEFQDTSRLQWTNLQPLIENSLASGHFNLVVGDGKQAIYRWRNGDADQFNSLPSIPGSDRNKLLKEREKVLTDHFISYPLKNNFRSRYEIIDFNNRFFSFLSGYYASEIGKVYDDPKQETIGRKSGGYVSIEFIDHKDKDHSYREKSLERILERIRELERDKFKWQDIAILCRKNKDGQDIARFLLSNGIRVISSEALLLAHSPEVNFVVGMMKFIHDHHNPLLKAELLTFLCLNGRLGKTELHPLLSELNTGKGQDTFIKILEGNNFRIDISQLSGLPVFELAEGLIRIFALNSAADPYLQFLLDAVMNYSGKYSTVTTAFLEWWETKKEKLSVIIPEGLDAVRIMTVHKAKGLQFPVVIHPFAMDKKETSRTYLWVDIAKSNMMGLKTAMIRSQKDILETGFKSQFEEEERKSLIDLVNLLYVAMTRAEERLYVMTRQAPEKTTDTHSIPVFFDQFFRHEGEWKDGKKEYESGQRTDHEQTIREKRKESRSLSSFISHDWREKIVIRAKAPEIWDIDNPEKKNHWGKLLHHVLSEITSRDDFNTVMEKSLSSGLIDPEDKEKLKSTIHEILTHPSTGYLFDKGVKVKKEAEILLKNGSVLRPDRVIFNGEEIILVDYKTGKHDKNHEEQLRDYENALLDMGYKKVRKLILYTLPEIQLIEI